MIHTSGATGYYKFLERNYLERLILTDSKFFLPFEWNKKTNIIPIIPFGMSEKMECSYKTFIIKKVHE